MTTHAYIKGVEQHNWNRYNKKLWQINLWEQIITSEKEFHTIAAYIVHNPGKWDEDRFNSED